MTLKPNHQEDFKQFVVDLRANQHEALCELIAIVQQRAAIVLNDARISPQDFEDIVQETVWGIYQKICQPEFHLHIPLHHYINKTLYYKKMDYRRKRAHHHHFLSQFIETYEAEYAHQIHKGQGDLFIEENFSEVQNQAQILSAFELKLLYYLIEEWTPIEIAHQLNVSVKRVYNGIYRLRKKLKGALLLERFKP